MAGKRKYRSDYYGHYFSPSVPREADGGIKAQSKKGAFGKSWWAKRWIKVLESFNIGARLNRGRSYARKGQVLSINIESGEVTAKVQGSRARPYTVKIKVKTLSMSEWNKLAETLSRQVIFSAKLLAGEMPENIEDAFQEAGISLFPGKSGDLQTDCSCPDWSNPCKHIAAVYYLLGEEFDRDPFLIFRLRGMEREDLTGLIDYHSLKSPSGKKGKPDSTPVEKEEPHLPPEPLAEDPDIFWGTTNREYDGSYDAHIPSLPAALAHRLGNFPFWRGEGRFFPAIEEMYRKASPTGMDVFLGESSTISAKKTTST